MAAVPESHTLRWSVRDRSKAPMQLALLLLLIGTSLVGNVFGIVTEQSRAAFQADSQRYVTDTIDAHVANGTRLAPMRKPDGTPYYSQFGLPALFWSAVASICGERGPSFVAHARVLSSILTSLVLAGFFFGLARTHGLAITVIAAVLFTWSPWLISFSSSLYWMLFLSFLPLALVAMWYRPEGSRGTWGLLLAGVALSVGLKCLAGYEYVTTIVAGTVATLLAHESPMAWWSPRVRSRVLAVIGAGVLGLVAALAMHAMALQNSERETGLSVLYERFRTRMYAAELQDRDNYNVFKSCESELQRYPAWRERLTLSGRLSTRATCSAIKFLRYFVFPALAVPFIGLDTYSYNDPSLPAVPLAVIVLLMLFGVVMLWRQGRAGTAPQLASLVAAMVIALLGGLSWQVLAFGHMLAHSHLNSIVFHLGFLPFALLYGVAAARHSVRILSVREPWRQR